jgi:hypothetical protein
VAEATVAAENAAPPVVAASAAPGAVDNG